MARATIITGLAALALAQGIFAVSAGATSQWVSATQDNSGMLNAVRALHAPHPFPKSHLAPVNPFTSKATALAAPCAICSYKVPLLAIRR
jgi:hypothetical protein